MSRVFKCGNIIEDSGFSLLARIEANGAPVTQAQLSAISIHVYNAATGAQVGSEETPAVAATIFDALQTNSRWVADTDGYNFKHDFAATAFPTGDTTYRIETKLTPTSGAAFHFIADVYAIPLYRS